MIKILNLTDRMFDAEIDGICVRNAHSPKTVASVRALATSQKLAGRFACHTVCIR